MAYDDIIEGLITILIIVILIVVMAPAMVIIGDTISQPWFGYLGAGILVFFGIIVLIAVIAKIFD